jgi:heme exporter protein C
MAVKEHSITIQNNSQKTPRLPVPLASIILGMLTCLSMMISVWMIFFYAPTSREGIVQRVFYIHIPLAWMGMLAFVVLALSSIGYLIWRRESWDLFARANAEIGAISITLALLTGSIWGKASWGTWWSWDPQLTSTLILWFMYIAYLMLRNYMGRSQSSALAAAVVAIVGVIDVPIIYLAASWWRTLHPPKQVGVADALPSSVVFTLLVSLLAFTLLYGFLLIQVYQLQKLQTQAERLRVSLLEA